MVGHVEWIDFVRVEKLPGPGDIVHALESWQEVGGGGAVAAVQLARLAKDVHFFTALGDDEFGRRSYEALSAMGVQVHAVFRPHATQRRALTHIDAAGERTITVLGPRLHSLPEDALPWHWLNRCAACYFTGGVAAEARRARRLVATTRVREQLAEIRPDAWVGSSQDPRETISPKDVTEPLVLTDGARGGRYWLDGAEGHYPPVAPAGAVVDTYGCGDSFAAGLTYALGQDLDWPEALELAARCGSACLGGRGPYAGQLRFRRAGAS